MNVSLDLNKFTSSMSSNATDKELWLTVKGRYEIKTCICPFAICAIFNVAGLRQLEIKHFCKALFQKVKHFCKALREK